jgi:hypothetical protein
MDWLGMAVLRRGPVVVLVFEGKHAFKKKIRAWKAMNGFRADRQIGVYVIEQHVNFLKQPEVNGLIREVERVGAHEVIVDTLAQSICADEENEQMQIAVNNAALVRRCTDARVVFIHHSGKDRKRGARGGSALTAAADTVLSLDEGGPGGHVLQCVRQRDGVRFAPVSLKLTPTPDGATALFERGPERSVSVLSDRGRDAAKLQAEVIAYLAANGPATATEIAAGLQKRKQAVVDGLKELEGADRVRHEQKGQAKLWSAVQ